MVARMGELIFTLVLGLTLNMRTARGLFESVDAGVKWCFFLKLVRCR